MQYEIREISNGYNYIRGGLYCSIKAAQKALGVPKPNGIDCSIRMYSSEIQVDGETYYQNGLYQITRIYKVMSKL